MSNVVDGDTTTTPKIEPGREGSTSSAGSISEHEAEHFAPEHATQQKRKGGRKPIYATSEERKQRNRQAQAAFRERRTEYIKQLEASIKHRDETLHNLQQSHRAAADECLMLRYKNSLLERILLERGIDVQAELNAKTGSPHAGPAHPVSAAAAATMPVVKPSPVQRAVLARQHPARRSDVTGMSMPSADARPRLSIDYGRAGPPPSRLQPTPPSQRSSPSSTASGMMAQGVMTPAASDLSAQHPQQQSLFPPAPAPPSQQQPPSRPPDFQDPVQMRAAPAAGAAVTTTAAMGVTSAALGPDARHAIVMPPAYYSAPFQNHFNQLEQEYDAQADLVDDDDPVQLSAGPGPHPPFFADHEPPRSMPPPQTLPALEALQAEMPPTPTVVDGGTPTFATAGELYGPCEARPDGDPFASWPNLNFSNPFAFPSDHVR